MKKKFLVVLLALTMVFAFSAAALAEGEITKPDATTTIKITVGDSTAELSDGKATVYPTTGDTTVGVTVTDSNYSLSIAGATFNVSSGTIISSGHSQISGYITYTITSQEPSSVKSYKIDATLDVYNGSGNTDLQSVTLASATGGDAMEKVEASGTTLTGHVDQNVSKVIVNVTVASNTGVTIDGASVTKKEITLNSKATAFDIVVTAQNGQSKTYKMTIIKDYDDTSLTIKDVDGPTGSKNIFSTTYPFGTKKNATLEFTPTCYGDITIDNDEDDITVKYRNGKIVVEFDTTPKGDYSFDITVKALNGDKEYYRFDLDEGEAVQLEDMNIMIGDDNSRNDLDYIMFPSKFDEDVYDYYVFVPWDDSKDYEDSVDVYISTEYGKNLTVKHGANKFDDDIDDYIKVGSVNDGDKETFTITVTADKSNDSSKYNVTVYYGSEKSSDSATLKDIKATYGKNFKTKATISPSFSSSVYNYIVSVPAKTEEVLLELTASDRDAVILCNDEIVDGDITLSDLKAGENKFKVVVVAENCDDTKTYNITVNVGATGLLSNLGFSTNAGTFNFSPVFASGTYNYVANVPNSVTTLYVTPTAIDDDYTIRVYKGSTDAQTVKSGKTSTGIALTEGLNEVKVYVYQSGSSKTYTLNIYRQPTAPNYQVSVQNLYVNGTAKTLNAVNIKGNNFLKLRDLAYLLNGTSKQFNVTYTESINTAHIHSLTAYVNDPQNPVNQPITLTRPQLSSQKVTLDGSTAYPIAYNVAGSNYVNLRQVCAMLDIGLTYSAATNTVTITTANSYTPGL